MASPLPEALKALVEQLGRLPGLGPKSALRIAMTLLKWPESETRRLGESIFNLRDTLGLCPRCGAISGGGICPICADPGRSRETLCIVPEWDSLLALESGDFYHGQYFVLGGLLSPQQKIDSSCLEIERLLQRLAEGEVREIILALGSTLEAENTVSYLKQIVGKRFPGLTLTRLAQGLPLGAEVKFMDRETLRQSLLHRQNL